MRQIISGAEFFDFETNPTFSGRFESVVIREKDSPDGQQKAGSIMGYLFTDINGDQHIIGASHQIEKALTAEHEGTGTYYLITFLGKGETAAGKPFNKFKVDAYDNEKEFIEKNKSTEAKK